MALIPTFFPDCVVAIGTYDKEDEPKWIASGFLYGYRVDTNDDGQGLYKVFLVTNRHVLDGLRHACIRVNPEADVPAEVYDLTLIDEAGKPRWLGSDVDGIDIA